MDVAAFLRRIGHAGPTAADLSTLSTLHREFVNAVPFENIDIRLGRRIDLDQGALFEKIVARHRGGICYELNGLFASLLRELGFNVTLLSGSVFSGDGKLGRDFMHLLLLVTLDRQWIADVGFGDWASEPLCLKRAGTQLVDGDSYRIRPDCNRFVAERWSDETDIWKPRYSFDLRPKELSDFLIMCGDLQDDPASAFRRQHFCTRRTPDGRVTLTDEKIVITCKGIREEVLLAGPKEYTRALQEYFGIAL